MIGSMNRLVKTAVQSLLFFIAMIFAYAWTANTNLSYYNLQLVALLGILYLIYKLLMQGKSIIFVDVSLMTLIVFVLIFSTGILISPFFFLIYFLIFGISFLSGPLEGIIFSIICTIFFLILPKIDLMNEIIQIGSLFMITPLALFLGKEHKKLLESQKEVQVLKVEEKEMEKELEILENNEK